MRNKLSKVREGSIQFWYIPNANTSFCRGILSGEELLDLIEFSISRANAVDVLSKMINAINGGHLKYGIDSLSISFS